MTASDGKPLPPRVIICIGEHCDAAGAGKRLYARLAALLDEYDFFDPPFKLRTANCFDMCDDGPNMVIYPGNRRFNHLTEESAVEVVRREVLDAASQRPLIDGG